MGITLHREDRELRGKQLSANTIASFLAVQGVDSVPELRANQVMDRSALLFLNRKRMIEHWIAKGWLMPEGWGYVLTPDGLDEVHSREADLALAADGKRKAVNVDPNRVKAALRFILRGGEAQAPVLTMSFSPRLAEREAAPA